MTDPTTTPEPTVEAVQAQTIEISWYLPDSWNDPNVIPSADAAIWDQTPVEDTVDCEHWIQVDTYWLDKWEAAKADILADGVLSGTSEDGTLLAYEAVEGSPWRFEWTGECVEEPPIVTPPPTTPEVPVTPQSPLSLAETGPDASFFGFLAVMFILGGAVLLMIGGRQK